MQCTVRNNQERLRRSLPVELVKLLLLLGLGLGDLPLLPLGLGDELCVVVTDEQVPTTTVVLLLLVPGLVVAVSGSRGVRVSRLGRARARPGGNQSGQLLCRNGSSFAFFRLFSVVLVVCGTVRDLEKKEKKKKKNRKNFGSHSALVTQ